MLVAHEKHKQGRWLVARACMQLMYTENKTFLCLWGQVVLHIGWAKWVVKAGFKRENLGLEESCEIIHVNKHITEVI